MNSVEFRYWKSMEKKVNFTVEWQVLGEKKRDPSYSTRHDFCWVKWESDWTRLGVPRKGLWPDPSWFPGNYVGWVWEGVTIKRLVHHGRPWNRMPALQLEYGQFIQFSFLILFWKEWVSLQKKQCTGMSGSNFFQFIHLTCLFRKTSNLQCWLIPQQKASIDFADLEISRESGQWNSSLPSNP